jgi:hypothetical protein
MHDKGATDMQMAGEQGLLVIIKVKHSHMTPYLPNGQSASYW